MDYSKIDWSKLPELPELAGCRLSLEPSSNGLRLLAIPKARYNTTIILLAERRSQNGRWYYRVDGERGLVDLATSATDIIDRFIAEQETEQQKPKPRRVTPKELLVELIETGEPIRVRLSTQSESQPGWDLKWSTHGLLEKCSNSVELWTPARFEWFYNFTHFDILDTPTEPPKPRLPVKTKAPEGYAWELDRHGNVVLRQVGTESTWGLVERSVREDIRGRAIREIAIVDASEELNPAT